MAAGNEMRVSDTEREAAAAELREHFASGRLNREELDERLTTAFAAKTRGDLTALFTDLPSSARGRAGADAQGGRPSGWQGPFESRDTFGPQDSFAPGGPGASSGWQPGGNAWRTSVGRGAGRLMFAAVMLWVLFALGTLGVFGIGAGRPTGIVLIVAALALLRRLLLTIFGRRWMRGRGPRRHRRYYRH